MHWKSLILGGALLFSPATLAAQATSAPVAESQTTTVVEARPALWLVRDEDTTIYLFGTIHLLKPEIRWFEGSVRTAFNESHEVVLEVTEADEAASQNLMMARALNLDGQPLSQSLDEASRSAYFEALDTHGVPPALFDRVKPWFAALTLTVLPLKSLGYSTESGVDNVIQAEAITAGKTLVALETAEQQIGFFEQLSQDVQLALLKETITDLPKIPETIEQMISAWSSGDAELLAEIMNEGTEANDEIEDILLTRRNARWADWIQERMNKPGTVFMAVGAGHLAGDKSVQTMLAQRGLATTNVSEQD